MTSDMPQPPSEVSLQVRITRAVFEPLARVQVRHPFRMLALAFVTVVVALLLASRLQLKTALGELLPANKRSVVVADEVNARLPAISTLSVVAEGSDNDGLRHFVDALAPAIRDIGPPLVGVVDEGVQQTQQFFKDYQFLYAPLETVQEAHEEIIARYEYEVGKKAGFLLDDDDPPPPLTEESIRKRMEERAEKSGASKKAQQRYPGGYYLDEDKHIAVILVRTPINSGDIEKSQALRAHIREAIKRVDPAKYDATIRIGFGGNLITSAETRSQIQRDLQHVGIWGISLIFGVVLLYYMRLRTVIAMVLTVGIGACWTFGLAYLLVGHLNSSTGFLFSIVVGNGINFGIIYMARYLEALRAQHSAHDGVSIAHADTWLATLTAAGAATCAYGSLVVTDFRGFKHFGLIGGFGMLLCWLATYLFLPPILLAFERVSPIVPATGWVARLRGWYGKPFAFLASHFPRAVTLSMLLVTLGAGYLSLQYVMDDPMEYNMNNIDNKPVKVPSDARRLSSVVDKIVGRQGMDGIALATDRVDQVLPLKTALEKLRDQAPAGQKPFKSVISIHSLIPRQQNKKLALIKEARATLENAHNKGFMSDEEWQKVDKLLPLKRLNTIGIEDLPEQVARHFTEKDGTRGRLVYITPAAGRSVWDAHYLITWANAIRETKLPDDSVVYGSGRSVIFADVIVAVVEDAPKAIALSVVATILIILLAFRARVSGLAVIVSVLSGLLWTVALLAIYNTQWPWQAGGKLVVAPLRLNFLNFVALPITVGVGADYAVNVMQRYELAGGQMRRVVVETGGAVILCSLTTMLGYAALTMSVNRAVTSFGVAAAAGELACVFTGVLGLSAFLYWRSDRRKG